jgi:hypothetical protein
MGGWDQLKLVLLSIRRTRPEAGLSRDQRERSANEFCHGLLGHIQGLLEVGHDIIGGFDPNGKAD